LLCCYYDLYQRLQLKFYVLLMTGAMDTRNMLNDLAVNKYLHTLASCWILLVYILLSFFKKKSQNLCVELIFELGFTHLLHNAMNGAVPGVLCTKQKNPLPFLSH
jgi:hypothetical protein